MEDDSPMTKTAKGAVTGLAAGTIWGTVVATWYDVPRVERPVALSGLIRTLKMCGTYGATFAAIGGVYIGVERAMQIRVRCGCGEVSCPEWAVVELQGVVQPQPSFAGTIRGLHIGRLCSAPSPSSSSSKAGFTFTVGYHELAGTKVTLKKPLLVLRKKKMPQQEDAVEVELEVIGVIRHKILFKDRPKALSIELPTKEKKTLRPAATSAT